MQVFKIVGLLVLAAVLGAIAMTVHNFASGINSPIQPAQVISNFDECAAAGNPVMESYPRQCNTADGRHFVEEISEMPTSNDGMMANGCAVAGCSQQLCVSAEEASTIMTTCEYRSEYICYAEASCEPQSDGKCGWTMTPELNHCLANPPALQPEVQ
ncbi:MAG: hypothetical protein WA021_05760 [Minisyncoccia bacterium]